MNIALLGYGRVSATLLKLLTNNNLLQVKKVLEYQEVIDEVYDYEVKNLLTNNFIDILYDDSIDLIIECFENRDFSYNYIKEALKKKEEVYVESDKIEIIDKEMLDEIFQSLEIGNMIKVTISCGDKYISKTGILTKIDNSSRHNKIVKEKILIDDIVNIEILYDKE